MLWIVQQVSQGPDASVLSIYYYYSIPHQETIFLFGYNQCKKSFDSKQFCFNKWTLFTLLILLES